MRHPNLILITVDSLRYDALSCMPRGRAATPRLDALARDGVVFDQAVSNGPRTQAAFPSILCSLYPLVAGEREGLPMQATTLAESLRDAGYATAAFNPSNPFLTRETGYDRGFDLFFDFWEQHADDDASAVPAGRTRRMIRALHGALGRCNLGFLMLAQALLQEEGGQYLTGQTIIERSLRWCADQRRPFAAWLHFMDVHYPYNPLPGQRRWRDRWRYAAGLAGIPFGRHRLADQLLRELYNRRVEYMDGLIGVFLEGLDASRPDEETVVVVTSDHGERFGEHGTYAHGPDLCEELVRVPLIVHFPPRFGHRRVSSQVGLIDLAPTVLELLGVPQPDSFQGQSRLRLLDGASDAGSEPVFAEAMHCGGRRSRTGEPDIFRIVACRTPSWKYVRDDEGEREELYDLDNDPGERSNQAAEDSELLRRARKLVDEHLAFVSDEVKNLGGARGGRVGDGDEALRSRLADLGYL